MVKKYLFLILFLFHGLSLFATAQYPDIIIYNGKEYDLIVNPMEIYFENFPERRPQASLRSTALWRGYIAAFEIIQNELWIVDIKIEVRTSDIGAKKFTSEWVSVIKECLDGNSRMKVNWYNGLLIIPYGEMVNYVHMGYASTYEKYFILEIHNGNLKRELNMDYKQFLEFREKQFELYKKTEEYRLFIERIRRNNETEEEIENFLRIFFINYLERIY